METLSTEIFFRPYWRYCKNSKILFDFNTSKKEIHHLKTINQLIINFCSPIISKQKNSCKACICMSKIQRLHNNGCSCTVTTDRLNTTSTYIFKCFIFRFIDIWIILISPLVKVCFQPMSLTTITSLYSIVCGTKIILKCRENVIHKLP